MLILNTLLGIITKQRNRNRYKFAYFSFEFPQNSFFSIISAYVVAGNMILIIFMEGGHKSHFEKHANLKQMTTQ